MDKYIINGGKELSGQIKINGAKNNALKILPAAVLFDETVKINNVPIIEDVKRTKELLEDLGAKVKFEGNTFEIDPSGITKNELEPDISARIRASILFSGILLAKFKEVKFSLPGGDNIASGAKRPINFFIEGFKRMGAKVDRKNNRYHLKAKKLNGINYFFPKVSHTGTETLMLTAVLIEGETVLKNCAMEPEITALADFLNKCGADIQGAGTPTIKIKGVKELKPQVEYNVIPDRIETGTFAIMAATLNSEIELTHCNPEYVEALLSSFDGIGVKYETNQNSLKILKSKNLISKDITSHEYPGFSTDLMSPYLVLMTQTNGTSLIHETIYDRRMMFTDTLMFMGANITMCDPHRVVVYGPTKLYGRQVSSPDIRAGIGLILAALAAEGTTSIENVYQINRGYGNIVERLQGLGADITSKQ